MNRRRVLAFTVVPLLLWLGHTIVTRPTLERTGDFLTFVAAGRGIGSVDIYDDRDMAELWRHEFNLPYTNRYIYPPIFAGALSLVVGRDLDTLFHAATTLNLALVPLVAALLIVLLTHVSPRAGPVRAAVIVAIALGVNVPLLRTLAFSQVNLVVLSAVLVTLVAVRWAPLSAAALATAVGLKMAPVVLAVPFARTRRTWWLGAFVATGGLLLAATVTAYGWGPWTSFVRYTLSHPGMPVAWNTSIDSLIFLSAGVGPVAAETSALRIVVVAMKVLIAGGVLGYGWACGHFRASTREAVVEEALFLLPVMLLLSPYAWPHGHLFVLPTIVVMANRAGSPGCGAGLRVTTAAAYAAIFLMPVVGTAPWSFIRMAGVGLLLVVSGRMAAVTGTRR